MTQRTRAIFPMIKPSALFPFLEWLPGYDTRQLKCDLVAGLVNLRGFIHAWRAPWFDGPISVVTFVCTLDTSPSGKGN